MGTTAQKINYAINATNDIAEGINNIGGNITQNTELADFREELDKLYNELPKTSQDGTSVSLAGTRRGKLEITPKGNTVQTQLTGKNLCDISLLPITQYGITISKNSNGNIIINGTPDYSDGYKSFRIGTDRTIPAGQYSVSIDTKINGIGFANGITYANLSMGETVRVKTTTTSENSTITPIINISYDVGTLNNFILNPQVEVGTPTDYEPYTGGQPSPNPDYPQNIKVVTGENTVKISGKNLFDGNWESGSISDANGTDESNNRVIRSKNYISVKPNTEYTVSAENNVSIFIYYYDENKTYISVNNTQVTPKTFTTPINAHYIRIRTRQSEDVTDTSLKCQVEKGSTATTYESYITPIEKELNLGNIELAKIGDYSDLIFKNEKTNPYYDNTLIENAWYKKKIINLRLYNENANFQLGLASTNDYYIFQTAYKDDLADSKEGGELVCDNFVFNRTEENYQKEYVSLNANAYTYVRFHISANRLSEKSVEAFKTWLQTHNVLIYYVLENPVNIQITDATLINQLEDLNRIIIQGGTITIETESDEENAQLIVNASALASFENS